MITVNPVFAISTEPADATIDDGQSDTLSVVATNGTPPFSYQWYLGTSGDTSDPIPGANNSSYTASPTSTSKYWVVVTDSLGGTVNSTTATITVNPVLAISTEPANATIDDGQSNTLSVAATNGTAPYSYQWYLGTSGDTSDPVPSATGSSYSASPTITSKYWVLVTDSLGTTVDSTTAMITVNSVLAISTEPSNATIDDGQNATLSVVATHGTPLFSYQWYIGTSGDTSDPIPGANGSSYTASPTSTSQYWVLVTDSLGTTVDSTTATITVNPALAISTEPANATIDDGQSNTLSVVATNGTSPYSYQWYIGTSGDTSDPITGANGSSYTASPTSTSKYWALVTDSLGGTVDSTTAMITVNPVFAISTEPSNATIDDGQSDTLSVVATNGTSPYSYQWYIGTSGDTSDPITGANGTSYTASPTSTSKYWVLVTDSLGAMVNSTTATITVNPVLAFSTEPANATIDDGQSDTLSVVATNGAPPFSYQWYLGTSGDTGDPIPGANGSSYTASPMSTSSYWVLVADSLGTTADSTTATITVNPALAISTEPANATIDDGQSDTLSVVATNGTLPYSYQWYLGTSGSTSDSIPGANESSYTASPTSTSNYWVLVTDSLGATVDSTTATITPTSAPTATQVAITSGELDTPTGTAEAITVELEAANGAAAPSSTDQTINLTTTSLTGEFLTSQNSTTPITSVVIPAGKTSVTVYYEDATAGIPTVKASDSAFSSSAATQVETIAPTPISQPPPVTVTGLQWKTVKLGRKKNASDLLITFSGALNPTDATDLVAYSLDSAHRMKKAIVYTKRVPLQSAQYIAAADTVSLTLRGKIPQLAMELTISSEIVRDAEGRPLAGNNGQPGTNVVTILNKRGLVSLARTAAVEKASKER
jgi:hypothetical protein